MKEDGQMKSEAVEAKKKRDLSFARRRLGDVLIAAGVIGEKSLEAALDRQKATGERLGEALINAGVVSEIDIVDALASQLDLRVFYAPDAMSADPEVTLLIPEHMAKRYHALALDRDGTTLTVAIADPLDMVAIDDIRVATGLNIVLQVGRADDIDAVLASAYSSATAGQEIKSAVEGARIELGVDESERKDLSEQELRSRAEDAPIIRLVDLILGQAISERATDIHIEPTEKRVVVRYRVDGILYDALTPPKQFSDAIVVRIKILSEMNVAERRVPLDGRFTIRIEDRNVDVRVSSLPTVHGEKVAMRLLDRSGFSGDLGQLGFEDDTLTHLRQSLSRPFGMVLISGPTGSGKTTTLYGGLSELDRNGKNITTLEDPVEYRLDRINQVSINTKAGMTFAGGLRALLRQDPDIVMIGEIRDLETAELAVRAALTGHLVLSTVHANDAPSTLTRMVDIGIEPYLVTSSVHMVMAQRLIRRVCENCKEPYEPDAAIMASLADDELEGTTFYRGTGCKQCSGRGYRGRIGVYEFMRNTPEVTQLVLNRESADVIRSLAIEQGMRPLRESALTKVRDGVTTIEEALSAVTE